MLPSPKPRAHIAEMAAYKMPDTTAPEGHTPVILSQNESLRPPSPAAIEASVAALREAHLYADPDCTALTTALARHHGIAQSQVLCGAGSIALIAALAAAYAGPERAVLVPEHAYPFFLTAAQMAQARCDLAPETARHVDIDALLASVRPDTALVFVANPGNPTGSRISLAEIARLRAELHSDVLLVVDEAYGEFSDHLEPSALSLGNIPVLRTFSKAYGLAGARVGWGWFPGDIAAQVRKVLAPNAVPGPAQAAARAALEDQAYMQQTCALTQAARLDVAARLAAFDIAETHTNFLLIDCKSTQRAAQIDATLRENGIFLRPQAGVGLPSCLRMTLGTPAQNARAVRILEGFA